MSPSYTYFADHTGCPDWTAASGSKPGWWKLDGATFTENVGGFDTATMPVLVKSQSRTGIKALFPRGMAHPSYPNMYLESRGKIDFLRGGCSEMMLTFSGLGIESLSDPNLPAGIVAMRMEDVGQNRDRTWTAGTLSGTIPGFSANTNGLATRVVEVQPGCNIWFVANKRMATPNVLNLPVASGLPTPPTSSYSWLQNPTRVYPNGWVLKAWSNNNIPGTDIWLCQWNYIYEQPYQPS